MCELLPAGNYLSSGNAAEARPAGVATWQHEGVRNREFRVNLQKLMDAAALKQPAVAKRIDVSVGTVSRWLSGERKAISAQELLALASIFSVDPRDLYGTNFKEPLPAAPQPKQGRPFALPAFNAAIDRKTDKPARLPSSEPKIAPRKKPS